MPACKELYEMLIEAMVIAYIMIMSATGHVSFEVAIPMIAAIAGLTISSAHTINNKNTN